MWRNHMIGGIVDRDPGHHRQRAVIDPFEMLGRKRGGSKGHVFFAKIDSFFA
jgi:hypothetical protein